MRYIVLTAVIVAFLGVSAYWGYITYNGEDRKLYKEAEAEYDNGNYRKAHELLLKALEYNDKNLKVLSLKAKAFFIVSNEDLVNNAKKLYDEATNAIDRREYNKANELFDKALENLYDVSPSYQGYDDAMRFQTIVINKVNEVLDNAPKMYFNKAKVEMARGNYELAYDTLTYITKPDDEVSRLKDDLAYTIGIKQYDDVLKGNFSDNFYINDAIFWLEKVSNKFSQYDEVKNHIAELKSKVKK